MLRFDQLRLFYLGEGPACVPLAAGVGDRGLPRPRAHLAHTHVRLAAPAAATLTKIQNKNKQKKTKC